MTTVSWVTELVWVCVWLGVAAGGYAGGKATPRPAPAGPLAHTQLGEIAGTTVDTWTQHPVHAFRGIPYALPPVGHLRFKEPVPIEKPWKGVRNAFEDGAACPQPNVDYYGHTSEDCLFLNVYTKNLSEEKPVIVFFHPGGFFAQTAKSDYYGPKYLLDQDVVLVTVNYRLGALGFLSTGDDVAKGNYGLKDQVAALAWVKDNIRAFGGNPDQVTIAGYDVGATSVLLHMLSPQSAGLFQRVIAMSGGLTSRWVVNREPLKLAHRLADLCDCDTSNTKEMVACLRKVPAQSLAEHYVDLREWYHDPAMVFGAVEEKPGGFLVGDPGALLASGKYSHVPVLMGITSNEFEGRATAILSNETLKNDLQTNWEKLAPIIFYYERGTDKSKALSKELRQHYFSGGPINVKGISKIYSDSLIIYGAEQTAKLLAKYSKEPVYFYLSNYKGKYSYSYKKGTKEPFGIMHLDDLLYLFSYPKRFPVFQPSDPEAQAVNTYTSMWSNFAHSGDPTPTNAEVDWKPLKPDQLCYLNIEDTCSVKPGLPYKERVDLWEKHFPVGQTSNPRPSSKPIRPHY